MLDQGLFRSGMNRTGTLLAGGAYRLTDTLEGLRPGVTVRWGMVTRAAPGPERTGTTGAMAFAEWCLSDDPLAVETRKKQIVLVMPCVNPPCV